ncbi:ABC transporter permease [Leucobacter allii]|uniref:ABC transporter permease n=1 Tax=Leucobacter allii TaxID=2932247 RepID=A0ABY4FM77_9MICO|nr:ABC transporter permease [Leucobacter allii]UOQ57384.1 ABC transporter permease [Leucobacter allii]UOR01832.1 ABC transporter permease [Leucobacter allii]
MRALRWAVTALAVPVVLVALWTLAAEITRNIYWPSPPAILGAFGPTWLEGRLSSDVLPSLGRLLVGFIAAVAIGTALGLLVGSSRRLRLFTEPVFELFRAIPPPVLVPIVMLFTGIGAGMQITVIAFGCVWPVLINTIEGVRSVDLTQLDTARTYRLGGLRRLVSVVIPAASPRVFVGARQALSIGIIMMVISEMFASTNGIGFNIIQFQRLFQFREMWAGIVLLGIIGITANLLFRFVERRVLRWYVGMQRQEK